jgi:hypothetical protein
VESATSGGRGPPQAARPPSTSRAGRKCLMPSC